MHSSSTLNFQRSFDIIRIAQPPLASFRDPAALLDNLHRGAGDPSHKNRILTSLVQAAHGTGAGADCAIVMLLLALWPGMDAIRHRLVRRQPGSGDEIASELLSRTTEAARSLDLTRVHRIAATILRNVERDMIRARQRDAARESLASDIEPAGRQCRRKFPRKTGCRRGRCAMSGMRFTPKGYGGHRRDPEQVKRDGWHEQGVLAVSVHDDRLTWPERALVEQLGAKLYGPRPTGEVRNG